MLQSWNWMVPSFTCMKPCGEALEPKTANGVTSTIGLFVDNVQEVMDKAIQAGATEINPTTDHDYGYRQGMFKDPFGHYWQIQKKI